MTVSPTKRRVLVTGGTGFVGANLVRRLVSEGHEVTLLVRQQSNMWRVDDLADRMQVVCVSLSDTEAVKQAVSNIRPEWVFHLAVHGAYSWQTDWQQMVETNLLGTMNLLEACADTGDTLRAFVNSGSSSEYGFKDHPCTENEWLEPNSHYAVTKAAATQYCSYAAVHRKLPVVTLRLYSAFGPYEEPNRLFPTLLINCLEGKLPSLVSPDVSRDYIYVDDVVESYLSAADFLETAGSPLTETVFNIGTGRQTSIRDLVAIARKLFDMSVEPQWGSMPNRVWDTSVWVANVERTTSALGWQATCDIREGLIRFTNWLDADSTRKQHYQQKILAACK